MLSARDRRSDRMEGLRAGADDFLVKPFEIDELAVRLEIARRIISIQEQLERQNARLKELATHRPPDRARESPRVPRAIEAELAMAQRQGRRSP